MEPSNRTQPRAESEFSAAPCSAVQQVRDPILDEQEHVRALLESTRGELQIAIQQWEYYRNKTTEFSIANDKFAELSRYALSELRHVLTFLDVKESYAVQTARAHIRALVGRFESGSKHFQYDETPSSNERTNLEIIERRKLDNEAPIAADPPQIRVEHYLEWSKNSGPWYFAGVIRDYSGAVLALQQERENSAKYEDGEVKWHLVRQVIERSILTDPPPNDQAHTPRANEH